MDRTNLWLKCLCLFVCCLNCGAAIFGLVAFCVEGQPLVIFFIAVNSAIAIAMYLNYRLLCLYSEP